MVTWHQNHKGLFLITVCILVVSLMVLSPLLVSCVPSVTKAEGTFPEGKVIPEPQTEGNTIIVTSTAYIGPGTLRQALQDARSGDTITFDPTVFPPSSPATIYLLKRLPDISQGNLKIDASNAGVILDGSNIGEGFVPCLKIISNGNAVHGLQIVNFTPGAAISLSNSAQHNLIGGDRSIGSGPLGQGNLASRGDIGIWLGGDGTSFNTIAGNLIGTDASGASDWGNRGSAIWIEDGAKNNTIGPDNVIAYNVNGIEIRDSNSLNNTITQNSIHDNKAEGIFLSVGLTELPAPIILDFNLAAGIVTGFASANCTVEIFSNSSNEGVIYEMFYEGQTTADSSGFFVYNKGASFTRPNLTATATDNESNTSQFSAPTSGTNRSIILQEGNNLPRTKLQPKQSRELEDNRIGIFFCDLWHLPPEVFPDRVLDASHILRQGVKRARFAINHLDSDRVNWDNPENTIDPSHDDFITSLADNGITMTFVLSFWDKEYDELVGGGGVQSPRFKTEGEIQRYLDFVRFIVHHFKDRIEYYEIWNEPTAEHTIQWIEVEDYINLVKRAVPIIRQEYPEAKIVVGGTHYLMRKESQDYLFTILRSDIMSLVDVVSWHGMYGTSPEDDSSRKYYYEYPSIVREIKDVASAHGFEGEYVADELSWGTLELPPTYPRATYSETKCAKYYARGIVMNLGMDVTVSQFYYVPQEHPLQIVHTIQNLCTVMAGAEPVDLPLEIQRKGGSFLFGCQPPWGSTNNMRYYTFSLPNGDKLVALWIDGEAADNYPGINTTVTMPGILAQKVVGIDVLYGFEQELITSVENGSTVINNLLVKDYPIILRLTK